MKVEVRLLRLSLAGVDILRHLVTAARPIEWVKNSFLLVPLIFSQNLFNLSLLSKSFVALVFFSFATSGIYLINDICDRESDKNHPQKCNRPIASGTLSLVVAMQAALLLLGMAIMGAFLLNLPFGLVTLSYVLLNIAYSNWLKHIVILDVFSIAAGFVLRVVGGAVVIEVVMSHWLILCAMLLALFLGFSKRRYELVALANAAGMHRRVLTEYDPLFLDMMIGVVTSATVVCYALYTVSPETVQRFQTDRLLLTLPFVLYGIFRYLYLVYHKNNGGAPSRALVSDGPLIIDIALWGLACGLIIYTANT